MNRMILTGCVAAIGLAFAGGAQAEYPDHPITYIIGYSPGGASDIAARTWLPYVEKCLGGTVIIEMKPGAAGSIGMTLLANAAPDGYTMGQTTVPDLISQRFGKDAKWSKDSFDYIGNISGASSTLTVRTESELKSLDDFLAKAKASATPLSVGIGGVGNDDHLASLRLEALAGLKLNLIPFGSGAETRLALLGGHVDVAFMSSGEFGRDITEIRPLAIAAEQRIAMLPDTPTFREKGYDLVIGSRLVSAAPKGVPQEALDKWRNCIGQAVKDPGFIADAEKRSVPLLPMTAEQTAAFIDATDKALTDLWEKTPWIK